MPAPPHEVLRGTLDMLILRTLSREAMHGWGISERIRQISREVLQVNQGALYPALHRLEKRALIRSFPGRSANNRKAKFYELTAAGRQHLAIEAEGWKRFMATVNVVMVEP